jgi:hypothetical protein
MYWLIRENLGIGDATYKNQTRVEVGAVAVLKLFVVLIHEDFVCIPKFNCLVALGLGADCLV